MADHHHPPPQAGAVMRDYRKGNWTLQETMILIEAKKMDDERRQMKKQHHHYPHHHSPIIHQHKKQPTELRWKWVEDYCWSRGCYRSQNQCNDKWDNLMRDYKKVRDYQKRFFGSEEDEKRITSSSPSPSSSSASVFSCYWKMERGERKDKNLPTNLSPQIYELLVEVVERSFSMAGSTPAAILPAPGGGENYEFNVAMLQPSSSSFDVRSVISPPLALPLTVPALPPEIQPPPPPPQVTVQPPTESVILREDSDSSQAKRRRRIQEQQQQQQHEQEQEKETETTSGDQDTDPPLMVTTSSSSTLHEAISSAISASASVVADAIRASHEGDERRHREMMNLQERMLEIDKSKLEISGAMVNAINNLSTSILSLANSQNRNNNS